jgi:GT2 family glycosyltransferase
MLVSRSKFLELGGFHPIFKPFYGEDFDLGIRAWYMGWKSYFEPNATLVHQSHGSIKDSVKRAMVKEIRRRNRYLLEWIHTPLSRLLISTIPHSIAQLLGEIVMFDSINVKGFFKAVSKIPEASKARSWIRSKQQLSLDKVIEETLRSYLPEK